MESPVWIPTGSRFSILQIVMAVSLLSRITSYSISLYPLMLFSISTWPTGERESAFFISGRSSSSLSANPPPVPPRVNAGRRTTGYPILFATATPSSIELAISEGKTGSPSASQSALKSSLSSAWAMLLLCVPNNSTRHSERMPFFSRLIARFSPVCPPIPGKIASGRSKRMILAIYSSVRGSI